MGVLTAHRANRVISLPIAAGFVAMPAALVVAGSVMVQQGLIIAGAGTIAAGLMAGAITDTYVHYRGLQVEKEAEAARANARTPEIRAFDTHAQVEYQPGMVFVPVPGGTVTLHNLTPPQLQELKERIRRNDLGLPINNMKTITAAAMRAKDGLRAEAVARGLAYTRGREVYWTGEGAVGVLRASPHPLVKEQAKKP